MFEMAEVQYNDNVQCLLESHARGILIPGSWLLHGFFCYFSQYQLRIELQHSTLATGRRLWIHYKTLLELFGIRMSTACSIFVEFVTAVNVALGPQYLTRPSGEDFV